MFQHYSSAGGHGPETQHLRGRLTWQSIDRNRLNPSKDTITFAYEGEEMDEKKTIKDFRHSQRHALLCMMFQENGIPEPGPAARRAGARVELLPGAQTRAHAQQKHKR